MPPIVRKTQLETKPPPPANDQPVTVKALADAKRLPLEFLHGLGLHNLPGGGVGTP
jgi:hypothetical protein